MFRMLVWCITVRPHCASCNSLFSMGEIWATDRATLDDMVSRWVSPHRLACLISSLLHTMTCKPQAMNALLIILCSEACRLP